MSSSSLNPVLALKDKGRWAGGRVVSCCGHLPQVLHSPMFEKREILVPDKEGDSGEGR